MSVGIIVSESTPATDNRYTWYQPSTGKWFELNATMTEWVEVADEDKAEADHTHTEFENLNIIGTLSADGDEGLTGQRTFGGYTLTFKKGLLVGFSS